MKWLLYPDDDEETEDADKNPELDQESNNSQGKYFTTLIIDLVLIQSMNILETNSIASKQKKDTLIKPLN